MNEVPIFAVEHRRVDETLNDALLRARRWPLCDSAGPAIEDEPTLVAMTWDEAALAVSFAVRSAPPIRVAAIETNSPVYADESVELFLSDRDAPHVYTEIVVNPLGTVYGARVVNPDDSRETWQIARGALRPGLFVKVERQPADGPPEETRRWSATILSPWGGEVPRVGDERRGNLYRIARGAVTRFEALSPTLRTSPPDFHVPSRFARLRFE